MIATEISCVSRVSDDIGNEIDLDSQDEITILLREKSGLREFLHRRPLTPALLEQLAPRHPLLKLVVSYRRTRRQLSRVESIVKAIRQGRVYPQFIASRENVGRISSVGPDLFSDEELDGLEECVRGEPAAWLRNRSRSIDVAQKASGDLALKKDRSGPRRVNLFMDGLAGMNGIDHDDLLLRVLVGESPQRLSGHFLLDRFAVSDIVHALEKRYQGAFRYLANARVQGLARGYVERDGLRRYLDGFASSNLEKRNAAQVIACRWLLKY
jgi:DNA polymerase I-like protein with 3'-5' exonuclease and polymerase domains